MKIDHDYYLIVDLEATCSDDGKVPRQEMEIIEIGAVLLNSRTLEIESEFQVLIRPIIHPELTEFCTELTGIRQENVDGGLPFPQALEQFRNWIYEFNDTLFCSWGDYDRNQFLQDCAFHQVPYPFRSEHMNLKAEFAKHFGRTKKLGISGALKVLGLEFAGSHHRGLDDARNIARIVQRVCLGT